VQDLDSIVHTISPYNLCLKLVNSCGIKHFATALVEGHEGAFGQLLNQPYCLSLT
jgi:hypothetical protein